MRSKLIKRKMSTRVIGIHIREHKEKHEDNSMIIDQSWKYISGEEGFWSTSNFTKENRLSSLPSIIQSGQYSIQKAIIYMKWNCPNGFSLVEQAKNILRENQIVPQSIFLHIRHPEAPKVNFLKKIDKEHLSLAKFDKKKREINGMLWLIANEAKKAEKEQHHANVKYLNGLLYQLTYVAENLPNMFSQDSMTSL